MCCHSAAKQRRRWIEPESTTTFTYVFSPDRTPSQVEMMELEEIAVTIVRSRLRRDWSSSSRS